MNKLFIRVVVVLAACAAGLSLGLSARAGEKDVSGKPVSLVAVLPFDLASATLHETGTDTADKRQAPADEEERAYYQEVADALRTRLDARMKSMGMQLQPPRETDRQLASLVPSATQGWMGVDAGEFAEALNVDAVVWGNVLEVQRGDAGLVSQTSIDGVFSMLDTRTGELLWHTRVDRAISGGLLLNANSLKTAADSMSEATYQRNLRSLVDEVIRYAAASLPHVAVDVARLTFPPSVDTIIVSPIPTGDDKDMPKAIQISLRGNPNGTATFDLLFADDGTTFKQYLPMYETVPGTYSGEYIAHPGDPVEREIQVRGRLTTQSGLSTTRKSLSRLSLQ